jgi:hypothetical protein
MAGPEEATGHFPGDEGQATEVFECEGCHEKFPKKQGLAVHRGRCRVLHARDEVSSIPKSLPPPPPPTAIRDPALKQIDAYEAIVAVVRKTAIQSITIEKKGQEWHLDARWTE